MKKNNQNYPAALDKHRNPIYTLSNIAEFSQGFAYYHNRSYPILMHSHDYYELNVVTNGECRHYVKNKIDIDKIKSEYNGVMFDLKTVCLLCKLSKLISQKYATTTESQDNSANYIILKQRNTWKITILKKLLLTVYQK